MKEVHLFIIWENARDKEKEILDDIKKNFHIIGLYDIRWNKENFANNLSRFYGTNLPKDSGKEQHCGNGAFLLVIVEVENPKYEKRDTSKGIQNVNADMFDKKTYYRELTGGGHKIHATNSEIETNHDLTLLLGKNVKDYLENLNREQNVEKINIEQDLIGQDGFKTVQEMFYVLNNCINYAIIRNYETLPDEIYVNKHNDIDLICDNYENAVYVLNGEKVFPEAYRVHYKVKVEDKFAFFDLRYIGDNYYYYELEKDILENRVYNEKGFYTIESNNYFYTLLYHALLHKPNFAEDYKKRLKEMNQTNINLDTEESFINLLNDWLLENRYSITKPNDTSVLFNLRNANKFDALALRELLIKNKPITEIDREIIKYINEYSKEEYPKVIENDNRVEIILALSSIRENIVSWYPFKENSSILEIGADLGQITGELCKKASKVVSLEISKEKREAIQKRHKEVENLTVIGRLEDIKESFDYITIIGIEEISNMPNALLKELKRYIKQDGKILLATDNRLGMKYFASTDESNEEVTNHINKKLYNIDEWKQQIEEAGYQKQNVYYPMTDYKLTNVIYTDKQPLSINNLSRNIVYNKEETVKFYEQNNVYRELLKENEEMFKTFVNSFFIEIFNEEQEENDIQLITFSNMRKIPYRIKTIVKEDVVYKYPSNTESKEHIKHIKENIDIINKSNLKTLDSYDEERIISRYSDAKTLDNVILDVIKEDKNKAIEIIKKFREELEQKLEKGDKDHNVFDKYGIENRSEMLKNMTFVRYGLWDLTFENCFYIENEFYFYDQEWREENLPIDFIIYRALKYFNQIREYISEQELCDVLNLDRPTINMFNELDDRIQEKIRDEVIWKIHTQGKKIPEMRIQKLTDNHTINLLRIDNGQKDRVIQEKNLEIQRLKDELNGVYNSRSWKITEPLRKIRKQRK